MVHFRRILVAKDLTPKSDAAMRYAFDLAQFTGAELHVVFAAPAPGNSDNVSSETEIVDDVYLMRLMASVDQFLTPQPGLTENRLRIRYEIVRGQSVAASIQRYATENDIDLIVAGSGNRNGLARHSPRPVSIVPGADANELAMVADSRQVTPMSKPIQSDDVGTSVEHQCCCESKQTVSHEALAQTRNKNFIGIAWNGY